jgi:hypothetical protein
MPFRIFLSYNSNDLIHATAVRDYFGRIPNTTVYFAEEDLRAGSLATNITPQIQNCNMFMVLISRNSQNSAWVQQEIGIARGSNKIILPLLLDTESRPLGTISEYRYYPIHDLHTWNTNLNSLYAYITNLATQQTNSEQFGNAILSLAAVAGLGLLLFGGDR